MTARTQAAVVLGGLFLGVLGWLLSAGAWHLYQDHLQVDQWRQEILNQQLQKLQQVPRTP